MRALAGRAPARLLEELAHLQIVGRVEQGWDGGFTGSTRTFGSIGISTACM